MQQRSWARRHLPILATVLIVIYSSPFVLSSAFVSAAAGDGESRLLPWAFPGAFANYSGSATLPNGIPYTLHYAWKVLKVTGTKAEVLTVMRLQARSGPPSIHHHVTWDTATRSEVARLEFVTNDTLFLNYDSTATVMGKTIPVTVYYYDNKGTSAILFISKAIGLPVQFIYALDNITSITVRLVETNISGLIP